MKRIKITKLSDDRYNGEHPFGVDAGYTKIGMAVIPPIVGDMFYVVDGTKHFRSTPVTEIVSENVFKTKNSTYHIEILEEDGI